VPAGAAQIPRRAVLTGGGGDSGRCVAEVIVDGAAEVEIRGDTAVLSDLSGRTPEWRRFECTSPMPPTAANIQFHSNGRGGASLVGSPTNGGPAVIRIQDSEGGASIYQLELAWSNGRPYSTQAYPPPVAERPETTRGRFGADQAVSVCRDAIRQQAMARFGTQDVDIVRINLDDNPGRRDWVVGTMAVRRGSRDEQYPFSCSVNFDNGRVRNAQIEAPSGGPAYSGQGSRDRDIEAREMDTCRGAVSNRIGHEHVEFGAMNVDNRKHDEDIVIGTARSKGHWYDFSCKVNPFSGNVRDVDLHKR
jgi:hypothetical protein